ncbi:hypothetical protein ACLUWJ_08525 [Limosilactobacillus mucosae]|uniref:hypothetical protein n=1 Tax=Limosilactobacillus mucosae TaxID=97478 RepID=UPI003995DB8C
MMGIKFLLGSLGRSFEEKIESPMKIHKTSEKNSENLVKISLRALALAVAYAMQLKRHEVKHELQLAVEALKEGIRQKRLGE